MFQIFSSDNILICKEVFVSAKDAKEYAEKELNLTSFKIKQTGHSKIQGYTKDDF